MYESGADVTVICPVPSRPEGYKFFSFEANRYPVVYLDSYTHPSSELYGRFKESYSFGQEIKKYVLKNKDSIDCIYANVWPLFSQYFLIKTACKLNIRVILHIQDIYPESITLRLNFILSVALNAIFIPMDRYVLKNSCRVITISEIMKNYLIKTRGIDQKKIQVIRNWQDEYMYAKNHNSTKENNNFVFMYCGTINKSSNLENVIKSYALTNLPNSKLYIGGDGPYKEHSLKIAGKFLNKTIEFISTNESGAIKLQSEATILVLPLRKGMGTMCLPSKLISYMLSRKPIIAAVDKESDVFKIINESKCGWTVEPGDISKLKNIMEEAYRTNPKELEQFGLRGYQYAVNMFSKANNLPKLINLLMDSNY